MEDDEYLVLECTACERSVKIKSNAAGTHFGCPYCKTPIEIPGATPTEEEVPVEVEQEQPPLAFRRIDETEGASSSVPPATAGGSPSNKGERRKHRRRVDSPDWDENRKIDDEYVDDDSSEFLEMDPDSPGGVRLKRVRRKKIATKKEKFLRFSIAAFVFLMAGVAVVFAYSAIVNTTKEAVQAGKSQEEVNAQVLKDMEAARAKQEQEKNKISAELTSDEEEKAVLVVNGFLDAEEIEEKLKHVRDPERIKPLMDQWYADNPMEHEWPDGAVRKRDKIVDQGRYFIRLYIEFGGDTGLLDTELELGGKGRSGRMFIVEQTEESMKLDWETAVDYQPMQLEDFKEKRPTEAVEFRVKVKPSDFYNFGFEEDKHIATELSYPGDKEFKLIGYLPKKSKEAEKITSLFENGVSPSLIVTLRYPDRETKDDSLVEIVSITSETWLR